MLSTLQIWFFPLYQGRNSSPSHCSDRCRIHCWVSWQVHCRIPKFHTPQFLGLNTYSEFILKWGKLWGLMKASVNLSLEVFIHKRANNTLKVKKEICNDVSSPYLTINMWISAFSLYISSNSRAFIHTAVELPFPPLVTIPWLRSWTMWVLFPGLALTTHRSQSLRAIPSYPSYKIIRL